MGDDVKAAIKPYDAVVIRFLQHYGMPSRAHAADVLNAAVRAGMATPAEVERYRAALERFIDDIDCALAPAEWRGFDGPTGRSTADVIDDVIEAVGRVRAALDGDDRQDHDHCFDTWLGHKTCRACCQPRCSATPAARDGDDGETLHGELVRRDGTTSDTYRQDR